MSLPPLIVVKIPVVEIHDWEAFHGVFKRVLGFPDYHSSSMDAWIDFMSSLDDPEDGYSTVHVAEGGVFLLDLGDCTAFARNCPEIFHELLDCVGSVNHRFKWMGRATTLALSFYNDQPLFSRI